MKARRIGIVAGDGVQLLDVAGPLDVFAEANVQSGGSAYAPVVVASGRRPLRTSSGLVLTPTDAFEDARPYDTLLVAGAPRAGRDRPDPAVLAWLQEAAPRARRYGSICSGGFVLAAAGLLDGRRVTTHWAVAEALAAAFPRVTVEPDALCLRDGPVRTAAGVTAGLDLALALVEEDLGAAVAREVAAQLVMYFRRPGGQMQFSRRGAAAPAGRSVLQELQRYVIAHPGEDHRVDALADRAGLSPRHFARLFRAEVGTTPAAWVEAARVEAARQRLEASGLAPKRVAAECGFSDPDHLRRAFRKRLGVTPAAYRRAFTPAGAVSAGEGPALGSTE